MGRRSRKMKMLQIIYENIKMPTAIFPCLARTVWMWKRFAAAGWWTGADGERGKKKAETGEQDERTGLYRKVLYPVSFAKHLPLSFSQPDPDPFR